MSREINSYGTKEKPLFLASDVAKWLRHSDAHKLLNHVDDRDKRKIKTPSKQCLEGTEDSFLATETGALQQNTEYLFLTEEGLFSVYNDLRMIDFVCA